MTSRERFAATLNRQEPNRLCVDFGAGRGARVIFAAAKTYRLTAQSDRLAVLSIGHARDLRTGRPAGVAAAGENPCVILDGDDYVLFSAPATGIGVSRSKDMRTWRTAGTRKLGLNESGFEAAVRAWNWARGRLCAWFVLDLRSEPRVGKAIMFFHGSRWPEKDHRGGWATHVSLGLAWIDDLVTWHWPGKINQASPPGKPSP